MTIQVDFQRFQSDIPLYLKPVEAGDTLIVCKDQEPIAEIRPITKKRPIGLGQGDVTFLPGFDESLPTEMIDAFEATRRTCSSPPAPARRKRKDNVTAYYDSTTGERVR